MAFDYKEFLNRETYQSLLDIKVFSPELIDEEAGHKIRTERLRDRMVFAAADHNARMITEYGGNDTGLSNRREYLARLIRELSSDQVDGVEASPDIIEDLYILNRIFRTSGRKTFLDNKILVGIVNRGGLKGTAWEMDDMPSAFTLDRVQELHMDAAKFMIRINPDDEKSGRQIKYCSEMVNQAHQRKLPVFIETLFVRNHEGGFEMQTDLTSLCKAAGVVSALGCTGSSKWLELPLNSQYLDVVRSTTCSVLVVPDEYAKEDLEIVREYTKESTLGENVRGILLGRNVMYSPTDPGILSDAIARVWHDEVSAEDALAAARNSSGI
jgi:DhnA family fructose-bisphosphate aldolase class Ia